MTPLFSLWGYAFAVRLEWPELSLDECLSAALGRLVAAGASPHVIDGELDIDNPLFAYELWLKGDA